MDRLRWSHGSKSHFRRRGLQIWPQLHLDEFWPKLPNHPLRPFIDRWSAWLVPVLLRWTPSLMTSSRPDITGVPKKLSSGDSFSTKLGTIPIHLLPPGSPEFAQLSIFLTTTQNGCQVPALNFQARHIRHNSNRNPKRHFLPHRHCLLLLQTPRRELPPHFAHFLPTHFRLDFIRCSWHIFWQLCNALLDS